MHRGLLLLSLIGLSSCSLFEIEEEPAAKHPQARASLAAPVNPATPAVAPATDTASKANGAPTFSEVSEKAGKWFYGPGVGRTMANVGTSVLFPPYAIYLIGNAALSLSGLPSLYLTDALPEESRAGVLTVYDGVTSVPGKVTSTIAGREFEDQ